ncbi:hypothetical protein A2767_02515 [Candidatus Roizmanbacteria bacterium RIFCSPHIGHO2_01_FULL_35_10]|uniref:Ribosome recycling factor domain-containing protein n=1 Tax=Candidatus Roizmanbacteria bacterium RIFCSPLOWO2_01_FULL_35_13 TaxID=1802055 RepID=A0A1F7IAX7_9BACT|nr:MAG: hypothetical protein A2767_02515 [Candidatus Roizmanbacteria bacterium RIFCSPHIGHO2_01_FULL_35_10]OGK40516.1 MAG: hypothetical protein A3A74_02905 [Candidatus Roizmanbacteria bacterium RIFCSPLOWO2_01_FULL_35_13]
MDPLISEFKQQSEKALSFLKEDFKSIRTGKSNPAILESLTVETYGGQSKLKLLELATIMTEGASALSVTPFDPATISDIEKAILKSSLGLSAALQGNRLLVKIPALSQEQREKFVKLVNQKNEEKRNTVRNFRDDARKKVKQMFEAKDISEDEKFKLEKDIDAESQKQMDQLQKIRENKEKEIMEI